jgi:hypothetical protein
MRHRKMKLLASREKRMLLGMVSVGAAILIAVAVRLVRLNWGSDALKSNGITAAVVGLVGLLATLWFSLKPPDDRERRFPVVFVLDRSNLAAKQSWGFPAALAYSDPAWTTPGVPIASFMLHDFHEKVLRGMRTDDFEALEAVYLDVLSNYVNDILCTAFSQSWDADIFSFEIASQQSTTFGARQPLRKGLTIVRKDLVRPLPHADILSAQGPPQVVVPPRTIAAWRVKDAKSRVLEMSNPFVKVALTIETQGFGLGSGALTTLTGDTGDDQKESVTLLYVVNMQATFERLRSGHSDMPAYTRWVDTLFAQVGKLNAEERWRRLKQDYGFLRDQQALVERQQREFFERAGVPVPPGLVKRPEK